MSAMDKLNEARGLIERMKSTMLEVMIESEVWDASFMYKFRAAIADACKFLKDVEVVDG